MSLYKLIGILLIIAAVSVALIVYSGLTKQTFAVALLGLSLFATPSEYKLNLIIILSWLGMLVALYAFTISGPVWGFFWILVFAGLAKFAGIEFDESDNDDWHWDHD